MRVTILILACLNLSLNSAYAIEVTQDGKKLMFLCAVALPASGVILTNGVITLKIRSAA